MVKSRPTAGKSTPRVGQRQRDGRGACQLLGVVIEGRYIPRYLLDQLESTAPVFTSKHTI